MRKITDFLYRLFFDRDDNLDTLQILFTVIVAVTLAAAWRVLTGSDEAASVKVESLITLRWLAGLLVITAVPTWMIPSITKVLARDLTGGSSSPSTAPETPDAATETPSP